MPLRTRRSSTRGIPRLVREHRFDDAPFAVAEFIAHDSMLRLGSLNHAQGHGTNGQTACPLFGASGPTAGTAESTRLTLSGLVIASFRAYDLARATCNRAPRTRTAGYCKRYPLDRSSRIRTSGRTEEDV